jgi:LAO/AO transport system kinase
VVRLRRQTARADTGRVTMDLASKVLQGDVLSAARLIRCLEDEVEGAARELEALYVRTGRAHVVGITGAPGVGKSTVLGCLIGSFRQREMTVGVVAVDPSSPFSGGAILGDRVRMQAYGVDKEVFIRSLASRGWKGGLSRATVSTVQVMDALGKDVVFVEAVGSGQADVDIAVISDTVVLVLNPGAGDEVQMMKAGILETADVFVVNKSDLAGAEQLRQGLVAMLAMSRGTPESGRPREIVMAEATCNKGTEDIAAAILRHREFLSTSGEMQKRREARARLELAWALDDYLRRHIDGMDQAQLARMVGDLAQRKTNPGSVVSEIIARLI